MAVKDYGLLVGSITDSRYFYGNHYQIRIKAGQDEYRIAVNIQSADKSDVMMYISDHYQHEFLDRVLEKGNFQPGFHPIGSGKGVSSWGLDFLRRQLLDFNQMIPMPMKTPGPDNDLLERVSYEVKRGQKQNAIVYAWGSRWQETGKDKYFEDMASFGIHDIHLNQGNPIGYHDDDNGTWQDGALCIYYPTKKTWTVCFLAFKSQFISLSPNLVHTDDVTGHPIGKRPRRIAAAPVPATAGIVSEAAGIIEPVEFPTELPNHEEEVTILAALLQTNPTTPAQEPGFFQKLFEGTGASSSQRKLLLLNRTASSVSLQGWKLVNHLHQEYKLPSITIAGYATLEIPLAQDSLPLSPDGDILVLLNEEGLKVHGVSYTRQQFAAAGQMICF